MSVLVLLTDTWMCLINYRNGYVGLLVIYLMPLSNPHHRNKVSLSIFFRYFVGRCSSELAELLPLPHSCGRSTRHSSRLHDFSVIILTCYMDVYVSAFFPRTTRLWNEF